MSFVSPSAQAGTRDFSAGFTDSPEADTLPPGGTPDARNAFFTHVQEEPRRVTMMKRPGSRLLTTLGMGAPVDGITECRTKLTLTNQIVGVGAGKVWRLAADTWIEVTGGGGFTPGRFARFLSFNDQLYIMDGTKMCRYDGQDCHPVGFAAPTSVAPMTAVAGGTLTGVWEALYTWYDNLTGHESSPSPITPELTTTNQARRHSKPAGGTPPTNVTHWRAYVRRVDTNESNFYRAATFTIAQLTGDEATSDAARTELAPEPGTNNPPPVFAFMSSWRGYVFGVEMDSFDLHISKQGDAESWNPKDVFPIRNGGGELTQCKPFGTAFLVKTAKKTYHLVGDRVPFDIEELSSVAGSVSQEAGVEVGDRFYDWDPQRGPYWTNTVQWQRIGDNRIEGILSGVERGAMDHIRADYHPDFNLCVWTMPMDPDGICRMLLGYDWILEAWVPPITGLEYRSLTRYTPDATGQTGLYLGDETGRLFELFDGNVEGVPSGTVIGTVTSATVNTISAADAVFFTDGDGLAGLQVCVISPSGLEQWRTIESNTALTITLKPPATWQLLPEVGWTVLVGGVQWYWWTPWLDMGSPDLRKRLGYLVVQGRSTSSQVRTFVDVAARLNDRVETDRHLRFIFAVSTQGTLWGKGIWGQDKWSGSKTISSWLPQKQRLNRSGYGLQILFSNPYPRQDVTIMGYNVLADLLPRSRARNV